MVLALHAAGIEVHPRRGVQPHRRGRPRRPDALAPRHRQLRLLPAGGGPATLQELHRLRQHGRTATTRGRCSCHRHACATGCWRCASTASASTWPRCSAARARSELRPASRRFLDADRRRTPCCAGRSSSPSRGTSAGRLPGRRASRRRGAEWNGRYRDDVRDFWRGDPGLLGAFATRLCGSRRPLRPARPRPPRQRQLRHRPRRLHPARPRVATSASTTRPTARTTATATDDNHSGNCGNEGPTRRSGDPRDARAGSGNLLATLFLSQGVPMLLGGDEFGRTQHGNNNAYCQDNDATLVRLGRPAAPRPASPTSSRASCRLRREHPAFAGAASCAARPSRPDGIDDLDRCAGRTDHDGRAWAVPYARAIVALLGGDGVGVGAPRHAPRPVHNAWFRDLYLPVPALPASPGTSC